ncbi:MAG: hypothetical protein HRT57_12645 [Crocinitomicaceae bacterium]|nr:hypothetical protein [Crocinitomicaceae bacterium]
MEQYIPFIFQWAWALEIVLFSGAGLLMINQYRKNNSTDDEGGRRESTFDLKLSRILLILYLIVPIAIVVHTILNFSDYLMHFGQ